MGDCESSGAALASPDRLSAAVGDAVVPVSPSVRAGVPELSHISGVGEIAASSPSVSRPLTMPVVGSRLKVRSGEVSP